MREIRMKTISAGPLGNRDINTVHTINKKEAARLVDGGFAEYTMLKQPETTIVEAPEKAIITTGEKEIVEAPETRTRGRKKGQKIIGG
jgi:hypothetical protein